MHLHFSHTFELIHGAQFLEALPAIELHNALQIELCAHADVTRLCPHPRALPATPRSAVLKESRNSTTTASPSSTSERTLLRAPTSARAATCVVAVLLVPTVKFFRFLRRFAFRRRGH